MAKPPILPSDPIPAAIVPGTLKLGLVKVAEAPATSSGQPVARINTLTHADDGTDRLFFNDTRGIMYVLEDGQVSPFLDLRGLGIGFFSQGGGSSAELAEAGFRSFAFHPDFENAGTAGFRTFYTMATHTAASAQPGVTFFEAPAGAPTASHNVLTEWKVKADGTVDTASRREVLRIEQPYFNHNTDQVLFNPNLQPGDPGYGLMFIGTGDGGGGGDPFDLARDPGAAHGKILRINPLDPDGSGSAEYSVPQSNPFIGNGAYLPEIWALGLRHPQNLSFDEGGQGKLFVIDIGQADIEEVNIGVAGGHYGWDVREGTWTTSFGPNVEDGPGFVYPAAQYDHDEGDAITGGYVYRGSAIPELKGMYLFGDIVNGRIFYASAAAMQAVPTASTDPEDRPVIKELLFNIGGATKSLLQIVSEELGGTVPRTDLRFGIDASGEIYITTKRDGVIRKLVPVGGDDTEILFGTSGPDSLVGDADDERLSGFAGDDVLAGNGGDDRMYGDADEDQLSGGDGADLGSGGGGDDLVIGGAGNDELYGDAGADLLQAGIGADFAVGGDGDDTIQGGDGNDRLLGQNGADELWGGDGNDLLFGGENADTLNGGTGNDQIFGGPGADLIAISPGADQANGGGGVDTYLFTGLGGLTTIGDFAGGGGGDVLDLAGLLDAIGYAGSTPIADGVLTLADSSAGLQIAVDPDGGPAVTVAILQGVTGGDLSIAANFVL